MRRLRTLAILLLPAAGAAAQDGRVPYEALVQQAEQHEGISPPPPPMESVLVGTLDAATGTFTWGPGIGKRWDLSGFVREVGEAFDARGIRAATGSLEPVVGSIADLGLAVDLARLRVPAAARARPASGEKREAGAVAQGATSGAPQGHSSDVLQYGCLVRAAKVALVFEVANVPTGARPSVMVRGRPFPLKGGSAGVVVPPCAFVDFTVACGAVKFADRLYIDRPPIFGFFTLEALPVAIVYEPPGPASEQTYTTILQVGTVLRSIASRTDTEMGDIPTRFSEINGYLDMAKTVGGIASNAPDPRVQAAGQAIVQVAGALKGLVGNEVVNETIAHTVTDEHELRLQFTTGQSLGTASHAGPGKGDVLHYLIKPVFGWLAAPGEDDRIRITVALLGYLREAAHDAETMRSGVLVEPRAEVLKELLALDPLTPEALEMPSTIRLRGGRAGLPVRLGRASAGYPAPDRLVPDYGDELEFSGAALTQWCRRTIEETDTRTEMLLRTVTTKSTAGYLSYVSQDVPKDDERRVTTVLGSAASSSVSQTVEDVVRYESLPQQVVYVRTFFDRAFGTFAFVEFQPTAEAQVTGEVTDEEGQAASGQPITIGTGEGSATVFTDAKGRFSFRSPFLRAGPHTLLAAGRRIPLQLAGQPLELPKIVASRAALDEAKRLATGPGARPDDLTRRISGILSHLEGLEKRVAAIRPAKRPAPREGGRLGRLVVTFPRDSGVTDDVYLYPGSQADQYLAWASGGLELELLSGTYAIGVNAVRTTDFPIAREEQMVMKLGAIRINLSPGTDWKIFLPKGEKYLTWGSGPRVVGLMPGAYEVEVNGSRVAVTIRSDAVEDF